MSTLTKVFVVLLVIFSIAFTTMTVSTVAQMTNWKDTATKFEEHARIADANLRHAIAASAARLASARDDVRGHLAEIGRKEGELQAARNESARLTAEAAKANSEKSNSEALSRGLLAQLQVADTARTEYRSQRDELEKRNIDRERRNIDLSDRVNELTAQLTVLIEQKRQYEQQINILRADNERLSQASGLAPGGMAFEHPEGAGMTGVAAMTPVAARAIRGRILEVSQDLVTISVGSADGVRKDMIFVIHRGAEYVGDVTISVVDPNQSAGRLVRSSSLPTAGDQVTDSASLSGSRG